MNSISNKVNIRPEVNILSVLRHLNYRPWFALAEFVDNAIQSYISNRELLQAADGVDAPLRVTISIDPEGAGRITITDNAAGIALADFPRAFRPAQVPPDRDGLSEFGMGMKSAACWFAKKWSVRTKALGESVERVVNFDIDEIVEDRIEELAITEVPSLPQRHYTVLELTNLCHVPKKRTIGKIKEHLASIYRTFLRDKTLKLVFGRDELTFEETPILKAPQYREQAGVPIEWHKSIEMDLGGAHKVTGFAALREVGSTTHAGFALFRRRRLIEGSADEPYRPEKIFGKSNSYAFQRLFGELHLSGFDVSHTKDGFRWEEHEDLFLELLKDELKAAPMNLLDQAEGYRAKQHKRTRELDHVVEEATNSVADVVKRELAPVLEEEMQHPANPPAVPLLISEPSVSGFERTVEVRVSTTVWLLTIKAGTDPTVSDWLRVGDATKPNNDGLRQRSVQVEVSLVHPFVERFAGAGNENMEVFVRFASAAALAAALSTEAGGKPQYFLHHLNKLLRETFAAP
ncbi:ATP-binding protein [Delftia acidovorans]|uniref:ATP-binding protein n=1 Tax=Delftia acidovorans TaxID=80866 RepID=UPI001EFDCBEB|nr:ATP-binding protein [Delftia acidovorans]MCG8988823.1 ATP-binding protein [Delftia acidovorans]